LNRRDAERSKNNDRIAKRAKTAKKNRNETADTLPRALNGEESSVRTSGVKPALPRPALTLLGVLCGKMLFFWD
jgi:hypothetical protein